METKRQIFEFVKTYQKRLWMDRSQECWLKLMLLVQGISSLILITGNSRVQCENYAERLSDTTDYQNVLTDNCWQSSIGETILRVFFLCTSFFVLIFLHNDFGSSDTNMQNVSSIFDVLIYLHTWILFVLHVVLPLKLSITMKHATYYDMLYNPLAAIISPLLFVIGLPFTISWPQPVKHVAELADKNHKFQCGHLCTVPVPFSTLVFISAYLLSCILLKKFNKHLTQQNEPNLFATKVERIKMKSSVADISPLRKQEVNNNCLIDSKAAIPARSSALETSSCHASAYEKCKTVTLTSTATTKTYCEKIILDSPTKKKPINVTKPLQTSSPPLIARKLKREAVTQTETISRTDSNPQKIFQEAFTQCNLDCSCEITNTSRDQQGKNGELTNKFISENLTQLSELTVGKIFVDKGVQCKIGLKSIFQGDNRRVKSKNGEERAMQTEKINHLNQSTQCEQAFKFIDTSTHTMSEQLQAAKIICNRDEFRAELREVKKEDTQKMTKPKKARVCEIVCEDEFSVLEANFLENEVEILKIHASPCKRRAANYQRKHNVATQTNLDTVRLREQNLVDVSSNHSGSLTKAVHSVTTLSEQAIAKTEPIRFKASKSQHGVWYVSLRGDIFLTISQEILNLVKSEKDSDFPIQLNRTCVADDIVKTMKLFVDNYKKLSDCFDEDEEDEDESYINGFRL